MKPTALFASLFALFFLAAVPLASASEDGEKEQACGYEIFKATADTVWRLNKATGEVSACKFTDGVMNCGSTDTAVVRPKSDYKEYQEEKRAERREKQEEKLAVFDRMLELFKKLIKTVKELEAEEKKDKGV